MSIYEKYKYTPGGRVVAGSNPVIPTLHFHVVA